MLGDEESYFDDGEVDGVINGADEGNDKGGFEVAGVDDGRASSVPEGVEE